MQYIICKENHKDFLKDVSRLKKTKAKKKRNPEATHK